MAYLEAMRKHPETSKIVGMNARRIRRASGHTLEQVAKAARHYGLPWSTSKVADLEAGRIAATLPNLIAAAAALADVTGQPVRLADLFAGDGKIAVNNTLTLDAATLRGVLAGASVNVTISDIAGERERVAQQFAAIMNTDGWPPHLAALPSGRIRKVLAEFSQTDDRVAKSLGISRMLAAAAMAKSWNKTFVVRRDELAGPDANAQRRGRVSRELKARLLEEIS